jgi:hypothetical protein
VLKHSLVLFLFLFCINIASAQYLKFGDFLTLLDLAEDKNETEKFMKTNGFALSSMEYTDQEDDQDTSSYVMDFYQKMPGDEYYIRVVADIDEDIFLIMEFSSNGDRLIYFASIIDEAGLKPYKTGDHGGGDEGLEFESSNNYLTPAQSPDDDGAMRYRFTITNK